MQPYAFLYLLVSEQIYLAYLRDLCFIKLPTSLYQDKLNAYRQVLFSIRVHLFSSISRNVIFLLGLTRKSFLKQLKYPKWCCILFKFYMFQGMTSLLISSARFTGWIISNGTQSQCVFLITGNETVRKSYALYVNSNGEYYVPEIKFDENCFIPESITNI